MLGWGPTLQTKAIVWYHFQMVVRVTQWSCSRVWARPHHCANPTLQLKLSLKKTAKGTICPLQNLGKKLERKHTRRDLFQYTNCKLKQKFYRTFKVHSKVMFQSCSTEHVRLMLNQAWWTRLAIVNMTHRKRVRTLESFFAPNQSQSA